MTDGVVLSLSGRSTETSASSVSTSLSTAGASLDDPGGGRSTDNVTASASLDNPGGGNDLSSPSVESTCDVMNNMGKDDLGGGNTNGPDSSSNFDTSKNRKALSDTPESYVSPNLTNRASLLKFMSRLDKPTGEVTDAVGLWWTGVGYAMRSYVHNCGG